MARAPAGGRSKNRESGQPAVDLKVTHVSVQLQTTNKLRDAILAGHFKPGDRLIEADLCEMMHVSRTSVREALRHLAAEKLITTVPNKGPSVTEISWPEAEHIYSVRAMLEGEAAALMATRATRDDIRRMKQALDAFEDADARNDPIGRLETTDSFYEVILGGCGNPILRELVDGLHARINFLRGRSMSRRGRGKNSSKEMRRILSAIERKDAAKARSEAIAHVRSACDAAREAFTAEGKAPRQVPQAEPSYVDEQRTSV